MTTTPPKLAFNLDRDVEVLSVMASSLTPYLYENELYGYLSGTMPRLTVGGLLLRLYRLSHLDAHLTSEQQNQVQDAHINFEAECSKWAVHYENKLRRELHTRLDALNQFLKECADDAQGCTGGYPVQAEKRIMIHHLREEAAEHEVLAEELELQIVQTDERLRRLFKEGQFITDERLKPVYPEDTFWWLYGYIPETRT